MLPLRDQFAEQKIGAGDQVLIALPNSPVFYRLIRRSGRLGLLPISIAAKTPLPELLATEWETYRLPSSGYHVTDCG